MDISRKKTFLKESAPPWEWDSMSLFLELSVPGAWEVYSGKWEKVLRRPGSHSGNKGQEKTREEWPIIYLSVKEWLVSRGKPGRGSREAAAVDNRDMTWHRETVIRETMVWMVFPGLVPACGLVQWLLKGSKLRGEGKENADLVGGCSREST